MTYHVLTKDYKLVGVANTADWVSLPGVSIKTFDGEIPDLNKVVWNEETLEFDRITAPLTKLEFMSRFTTAERLAISASSDAIVKDAMSLLQLAEFIDVNDQRTVMTIGYLAQQGYITSDRVTQILA